MKFPVEKCECGQDLTKATPVRLKLGVGPHDEPVGGCPNCWRTYSMVEDVAVAKTGEVAGEKVEEKKATEEASEGDKPKPKFKPRPQK